MVFFPLINKRSFKKLIVLYNGSFLFLLLLPAALISRNMVLLESCHQIFRVGWSHCLLQLPEVPKAESEFLHQRVNELMQLCPSTKPPSPRIYRIWLPRQKKQIPNFLHHIEDLSLRPFHCTSGLSAVENPTWAPALLETVVWHDAALPPLCPRGKAVLYRTDDKTVASWQMVKMQLLLPPSLQIAPANLSKGIYTLFSCQRLFTNVRGWQPESQLGHVVQTAQD